MQHEDGSSSAPISDGSGRPTLMMEPSPDPSGPDSASGAAGSRPSFSLPSPRLLDGGPASGSNGESECGFHVASAQRRRLDMYLVIDNNSTLRASGAWEDIASGLSRFVSDTRSSGTGIGIRYFGSTCNPAEYAEPTVDIDLPPTNAADIVNSTKARRWTASPMLPALEGGLAHQRSRARLHPEWKQIVVLVSDPFAQDFTCLYTTLDVAETARDGLLGFPSIETHVIGVGVTTSLSVPLDELIARSSAYHTIANAGGSGDAILTAITDDGSAFGDALQQIRRKASPCEFQAPAAMSQFSVVRYPVATELPRVSQRRSCNGRQGWYYADESLPTPVTMCPATCEWLRESDDNQVAMLVACPNQP